MSLAEELAAPPPATRPVKCLLCRALEDMDDTDATAVEDAVYGRVWSDPAVARKLKDRGLNVPPSSLANHRQKDHGGRL